MSKQSQNDRLGPETRTLLMALGEIRQELTKLSMAQQRGQPTFKPISKANVFSRSVATGTNILGEDVYPSNPDTLFRIEIALGSSVTFNVRRTRLGTIVVTDLNEGLALTANATYLFDIKILETDTVNFRHGGAGSVTVLYLNVSEISAAAT